MSIAPYLRTIGRGKDGARSLARDQAFDLMSRIFEGRVSDLELGGFALAMRIKGESADELAAFVDAAVAHTLSLQSPSPAVLLPSYNGARKLPNFTPLLALLLARRGVPVLVHGPLTDAGRVTSAEIFTALGLPTSADAEQAAQQWALGQPVFMALEVLNRPLAQLLAVRRVLGLRNSGHTIAKLLPAVPGALRVVNHTHPEYAISLSQYLRDSGADAVLIRGTEGEPVADCRRQPRMDVYLKGVKHEALSLAPQEGVLVELPALPVAIDAASTAAHIRAVLAGEIAVPEPIARQVDALCAAQQLIGQQA
ncbi:glycosyl transferase family 3 [Leptothrix cholodnii SP-6]|uniref:Glycosyl transferase family 3 n=1 Tax=Leptothrix cholodnii (strain ATCC 51168 / LMG 8142 / SP-6) TaxID=395495 RepID=B1Y885_LEPCP|nr:DNA-binding protein YbiB [Leptothrix cholodnii]ACB34955.1 glycosyl transferase family 3 [Leptothrix cholodnii SP-6]